MNAFMIFARRRRPQVSAANQTMRTGDISKILSKEWNSMDMVSYPLSIPVWRTSPLIYTTKADKQFYLDQAKRLKETFNSKYPDYVYRRRPNNSRKKRRPDATANPLLDPSTAGDAGDDFPTVHDFDYQPVDGHDPVRDLASSRSSSHSGVAPGYGENSTVPPPHHGVSPYGYSVNDYPPSHVPPSGTRLPHLSSIHDHPPPEAPSMASLPSHHYGDTSMHSHAYPSQASQPPTAAQSSSAYGPDHITGPSFWGSASGVRGDHGRAIQPTWTSGPPPPVIPPLHVGEQLRERPTAAGPHTKSEVYSGPSPHPWSISTSQSSPAISIASSRVSSRSSNKYPLQTLSSPFFPASHSPGAYQSSTSSSSTPSGSPENYYPSGSQLQGGSYGGRAGSGYEQSTIYTSNPVLYSNALHYTLGTHKISQLQSRSSRPSLQTLTIDSGMNPLSNSSSGTTTFPNSSMDHWRTKIGG
jgi:HMG (high mobility group) box